MIVEVTLLDSTPAIGLYHHAWWVARQFVLALNIGTIGFWWWHFSPGQSTWYEGIQDLDHKDLQLKINQPERQLDWGEDRVLTPDDMKRVCQTALKIDPISASNIDPLRSVS